MKRRVALKHIMMAAAAVAVLPSCVFEKKKVSVQLKQLQITADQEEDLAEIVDTMIPATDIPGAKAVGSHIFVLKMIDDCYDKKVQDSFMKGLDRINQIANKKFGSSFVKCSPQERTEVLTSLDKKETPSLTEDVDFFPLLKQLTIQGFLTSQYIMQDVQGFQLIPGHFYGCVDVQKNKLS